MKQGGKSAGGNPEIENEILNKLFNNPDSINLVKQLDKLNMFPPKNRYTYKRKTPKIGRNEKCPCGCGKKYKYCALEKIK